MTTGAYPRVILVAAFFVALAALIYVVHLIYVPLLHPILEVAPPFVIAIVLAFLLDPVVDWIQRKGLSRDFGVAIVGLTFLIAFILFCVFVIPKIADQSASLANSFDDNIKQAQIQINGILSNNKSLLQKYHLPITVADLAKRFSTQTQDAASRSLGFIASALSSGLSRILWIVIIPMSTLWLLRDLDNIKAKIVHLTPDKHKERLISLTSAVGGVFGKYVRGMLVVAILFSVVASVVLTGLGLRYGLIIGAGAGLMYLVPYVGVAILALTTGITALVQPPHSLPYAGLLMLILVVQSFIVFDLFVTPKVVGRSVGVHPIIALFALALGARLFGVVGMVAAVPVAASLQVALGQIYPKINDKLEAAPKKPIKRKKK